MLEHLDLEMTNTLPSETSSLPFSSFIKFPKLPTELQVMIWKFTFPGRRLIQFSVPYLILRPSTCQVDPPIPIAHSVCTQSRQLLLRHYRIIYEHYPPETHGYRTHSRKPSRSFLSGPFHRPICFDPTIDQFCMDASEMSLAPNKTAIAKICAEFPGSLDAITVLEVLNTQWVSRNAAFASTHYLFKPMSSYDHFQYGALNSFRNLKELHLVASKHPGLGISHVNRARITDRAYEAVMRWYRQARDMDGEGFERKIPKVYFHDHRREQAMTDEEIRRLARIQTPEEDDQNMFF